jgi:hypothetical protein
MLTCAGDVQKSEIHMWAQNKADDISKWLHHQPRSLLTKVKGECK